MASRMTENISHITDTCHGHGKLALTVLAVDWAGKHYVHLKCLAWVDERDRPFCNDAIVEASDMAHIEQSLWQY